MFEFLRIKKKNKKPKNVSDKENLSPETPKQEHITISPILSPIIPVLDRSEFISGDTTYSLTQVTNDFNDNTGNTFTSERPDDLTIELPRNFVSSNEIYLETIISKFKTCESSLPTPISNATPETNKRNEFVRNYEFETPCQSPNTFYRKNQDRTSTRISRVDMTKENDRKPKGNYYDKPPCIPRYNSTSNNYINQTPKTPLLIEKTLDRRFIRRPRLYHRNRFLSIPNGHRSASLDRPKDDPIYLAKFPGGYEEDPDAPKKIETLEWLAYDTMSSLSLRRKESYESESFRLRSRSADQGEKQKKFTFDTDNYDYVSLFRHDKSRTRVKTDSSSTQHHQSSNQGSSSDFTESIEDNKVVNVRVKHLKQKLKSEIEEISKIENKSYMAAQLLPEIKSYEQDLSEHGLDPWKSSRSRNADLEPSMRTRYYCPINASPSRVCRTNCATSNSSSPFTKRSTLRSNGTNTPYCKSILNTSRSSIESENVFHDEYEQNDFKFKNVQSNNPSTPNLVVEISHFKIQNESSSTKQVLKPGYGLVNSNKICTTPKMAPAHISLRESFYKRERKKCHSGKFDFSTPYQVIKRKIFPYEMLKTSPYKRYPNYIDREKLERYLSKEEFQEVFEMTPEQFYNLPDWKQNELKKKFNLF